MNTTQLLTETQAAELAQVQPKTIADWGRAGKLPRVCLSARCIRYRMSDVQAMIDASVAKRAARSLPKPSPQLKNPDTLFSSESGSSVHRTTRI